MTTSAHVPVDKNHKRAISGALSLLDEMLCEFEDYAHGRERRSVLYVEQNSLTPERRRTILTEISAMRGMIGELRENLGLAPHSLDVLRHIWGCASAFWEVLVETESKYLRRYGDVDPALARYLDPRIKVLIEHLMNIVSSAQPLAEGRSSPSAEDAREKGHVRPKD